MHEYVYSWWCLCLTHVAMMEFAGRKVQVTGYDVTRLGPSPGSNALPKAMSTAFSSPWKQGDGHTREVGPVIQIEWPAIQTGFVML